MGLSLSTIGVITAGGLLYRLVLPRAWRQIALILASVVVLYLWQPFSPLQWAGFLLPTFMLFLVIGGWWLSKPAESAVARQDWLILALLAGVVLLFGITRYIDLPFGIDLNRPPPWPMLIGILAVGGGLTFGMSRTKPNYSLTITGVVIIILFFIALKNEWIATQISRLWRAASGRDPALASATDLIWLGYSYIAFRLMHTLRDRATGQLPALSLGEYVGYTLFFPALIAGPIDRAERFHEDWSKLEDAESEALQPEDYREALLRIAAGLFKKFVIADSLAFGASLTPILSEQVTSPFWAWVLLYGYAFRLYFDFAGYTDIVIGLGLLFGVRLPENFKRPYLKTDLATFWQSWHITLSNWVRFYVFSPLSRSLLRRKPRPSPTLIVFVSQLSTMLIIGLWHGITWNFFIWGAWHGLGLFVHKRFNDLTRTWQRKNLKTAWQKRAWAGAGWFITFQFVVLGWVWFALPGFSQAFSFFGKLFGFV